MKNKVLTFIIGVLTGAIIATAGFLIYSKISNPFKDGRPMMGPNMEMGERPEMPEGMKGRGQGGRQPGQAQPNVEQPAN